MGALLGCPIVKTSSGGKVRGLSETEEKQVANGWFVFGFVVGLREGLVRELASGAASLLDYDGNPVPLETVRKMLRLPTDDV